MSLHKNLWFLYYSTANVDKMLVLLYFTPHYIWKSIEIDFVYWQYSNVCCSLQVNTYIIRGISSLLRQISDRKRLGPSNNSNKIKLYRICGVVLLVAAFGYWNSAAWYILGVNVGGTILKSLEYECSIFVYLFTACVRFPGFKSRDTLPYQLFQRCDQYGYIEIEILHNWWNALNA